MSMKLIYGFPCVEDPNDFSPDAECCSPEEMAAHRTACVNYGKPAYEPNKGCFTETDESGKLVRHVLRTSWGIGMNLIRKCDGFQCDMWFCEFVHCHECGGDYCEDCWPKHDADEDCR